MTLYGDNDGRTVREENRTDDESGAGHRQARSSARRRRPSTRTTCARRCAPGETEQVSNGDTGFDVAFDRVIDQPGQPERREHYTWHYTMLPNQILVGSEPAPPTTTSTTPLHAAPSHADDADPGRRPRATPAPRTASHQRETRLPLGASRAPIGRLTLNPDRDVPIL